MAAVGMWRAAGEWLGLVDPAAGDPVADRDATFADTVRTLDQLIIDFFSSNGGRVSRDEALAVPAIRRGRNLICTSVATLPLVTYAPDLTRRRSAFLDQIDPDVPNVVTKSQTVEDLLCESVAWWKVLAFGWDNYPVAARRVDPAHVRVDPPPGRSAAPLPSGIDPRAADPKTGPRGVWIDGVWTPAREVIRFDSPNPPLLSGARTIRRAILLDQAAAMYADDPRPLDYFTPAEGVDPASDERVAEIMRAWRLARKQRGTAYVPAALKYNSVDAPSPADLRLPELQKQANLDLANLLGVDAEDLGVSTTSRTYFSGVDRRKDKINETLAGYMSAITDRLSMRDVSRQRWSVAFNLDDYMRADPKTRWEVYTAANAIRDDAGRPALTVAEIRQEEKLTPYPDAPPTDPADPAAGAPVADDPAVDPDQVVDTVDAAADQLVTFAGDPAAGITFAADVVGFSVDTETRTVRGRVAPTDGSVGRKFGMKFRFAPGSIEYGDAGRVKLLRDHDPRQPLGRATTLDTAARGVDATFSVAPGPEGDRALELAAHGTLDGLSVGVDFDAGDTAPDPKDPTVTVIKRATLREVSMVAVPAFDGARVTSVTASRDGGTHMEPDTGTATPPATGAPATPPATPAGITFDAETAAKFAAFLRDQAADDGPQVVDPTVGGRPASVTAAVTEPIPYRFDRAGNFAPITDPASEHVFAADLHEMADARDLYGKTTAAGRRVMALLTAAFDPTSTATFAVGSADVDDLNPTIRRPDMYVDQRDYPTPLWDMVSKGAPPNGVQPFIFPKFNSAAGLVGDHTEGTEPTSGSFTTTSQTVQPTALSGKASIPREVWDMGGTPAVSGLIFAQMRRGYREGLETATATFLATLTAAADIALTAGATDEALAAEWDAALADLQFVRGYDFSAFAIEKVLYKAFVAARDTSGRVLYPILAPANANGTAASRFRTLDLGGVTGVPSWALASTAGAVNSSWLFDRQTVWGWATGPTRLEFPGTDAAGGYAPVAMVDLAIWGYKAFANTDLGGVRQVTYDSVP